MMTRNNNVMIHIIMNNVNTTNPSGFGTTVNNSMITNRNVIHTNLISNSFNKDNVVFMYGIRKSIRESSGVLIEKRKQGVGQRIRYHFF